MSTTPQISSQNQFFSSFSGDLIRSYLLGFNGKEKLNEAYGEGNAYDFGARIYDPRICRWLAVDPLQLEYPNQSPYSFALNSPLQNIDVAGEWVEKIVKKYYKDKNGDLVLKKTFWDLFKKTVRKEVHLRIHNMKVYNVDARIKSADGYLLLNDGQKAEIADKIQTRIEGAYGTIENPKTKVLPGGKEVVTCVEFVDDIKVINDLNEVKNGKNPDDLILLVENIQDWHPLAEKDVSGYVVNQNTMMVQVGETTDATTRIALHEFTHQRTRIDHDKNYPENYNGAYMGSEATEEQMDQLDTGGNSNSQSRGSNWNRITNTGNSTGAE